MSDDREREHAEASALAWWNWYWLSDNVSDTDAIARLAKIIAEREAAARADLPRALAVIEAADRVVAIASRLEMGEDELDEALAAYRKARHGQ